MKKILLLICLLILPLGLVSCDEQKEKYSVVFDTRGGDFVDTQYVYDGDCATKPEDPLRNGFDFLGWYLDNLEFDFNTPIKGNIRLYASWQKKSSNDQEVELMAYYDAMSGHFDNSFKTTLHSILKSTHKTKLTYTPGVWNALNELDEDPDNSNNVICIYTGRSIPKTDRDGSSNAKTLWNREHSWPKCRGFKSEDYYANTDIHHLFASEKGINGSRDNKDFNNVKNGSSDSYGNKWTKDFFEPRDEVKGDLARAMFYMVVRYDDEKELDLELVDSITSSSSNKTGQLGFLSTLLEWNLLDPVSEKEKIRNEKAYQIQGNRNPFIDYPQWINYLYPTL